MFGLMRRKLRAINRWLHEQSKADINETPEETGLSLKLDENLKWIKEKMGSSPDVTIRRFIVKAKTETAAIVFIDGLTDKTIINEHILRPLMNGYGESNPKISSMLDYVKETALIAGEVKNSDKLEELVDAALAGDAVLLIDRCGTALIISAKGWEKRGISEPDTEIIVKGPRDGFVETLRTNTALLRRRIGHPSLTFEEMRIGKKTRTDVSIAYLKGLANEKIVQEVRRRLRRIDIDGILAAGYIEQLIEDAPFSLFSTTAYTERPDVCAAKLMEGRVAIFIDGTPVVVTVPVLFVESFQSPDDYNFRPFYSTLVRWSRYLSFIISILLPAIYVALSSFHPELLPTPLLISMASATEGTPFPAAVEALGMGIVFEILREAGIRIPRPIGQAVSIVGALVIGEATVTAGLVGAPVVIVVAFTAIASFVVPIQAEVSAWLRLALTVMASVLGAYGIIVGLLLILVHLSTLRSFGVPYLSPIAPMMLGDMKDVVVRAPLWAMLTRPKAIGAHDPIRQDFRLWPDSGDAEDSEE